MGTRVTVVNGSTYTGVYAADGSINVVVLVAPAGWEGVYHDCGAFNVVMSSDQSLYHASGAYNAVDEGGGVYSFGMFRTNGVSNLDPDALSVIIRMTTPPNNPRAQAISRLVTTLKGAGLWTKTDVLYVLAAADSQAALLNWKSAFYTAAVGGGAPVFTADRGYTGNGTSTFLSTGFSPATLPAGLILSQNSAHLGAYVLTAGTTNGSEAGSPDNRSKIRCRPTASGASGSMSTTTGVTVVAAGTLPLHGCVVRRDAANQHAFSNGALGASGANTSAGLPTALEILRSVASYTDRQVAAVHAGGALSDAEVLAYRNALLVYLQTVGAAA